MTFPEMENATSPIATTRLKRQLAEQAVAHAAAGTVFSPAATSSVLRRSMLRSAMRLVGSRASAAW